jgi:hypothetical protein
MDIQGKMDMHGMYGYFFLLLHQQVIKCHK